MKRVLIVALAVLAMSPIAANANYLLIDDFSGGALSLKNPVPPLNSIAQPGALDVAGDRRAFLSKHTGIGAGAGAPAGYYVAVDTPVGGVVNLDSTGEFMFKNDFVATPGTPGGAPPVFTAPHSAFGLGFENLGGLDLTSTGPLNPLFGFRLKGVKLVSTNATETLRIRIGDINGVVTEVIAQVHNNPIAHDLTFNFNLYGLNTAVLQQAKGIHIEFEDTSGISLFSMGEFGVASPEPTSLGLLGMGACCLAGWAIRRRKAAK